MSSNAGNHGIQILLEAEKEASKVVQRARQYRVQRLKDARTEALAEIEALKNGKTAEFAVFESSFMGSLDEISEHQESEIQEKLKALQTVYEQSCNEIVQKIVQKTCDVRPKLHQNVAMAFEADRLASLRPDSNNK